MFSDDNFTIIEVLVKLAKCIIFLTNCRTSAGVSIVTPSIVVSVYGILFGCTHSYYYLHLTFAVTVVVVVTKPVRSKET